MLDDLKTRVFKRFVLLITNSVILLLKNIRVKFADDDKKYNQRCYLLSTYIINFTDWVNNEILTAYKQKPELGTVLFGCSGGHKDGN